MYDPVNAVHTRRFRFVKEPFNAIIHGSMKGPGNNHMQNIGVGTDIVEIHRFKIFNDPAFFTFLTKNFTPEELDYCLSRQDPAPHLAARFAGKEAVIKALYGIKITGIFFPAIEILNDEHGVPYVRINTSETEKLSVKISLSHSSDMALAFCIIIQEI
jgi:holo-[acyl-carrier protein] synthase